VSRHHKIERDLAALSLEKSKLEAEYQKLLQKRIRTQEALKRTDRSQDKATQQVEGHFKRKTIWIIKQVR
jgi:hypothetical protein